jgi:hypothetical protein
MNIAIPVCCTSLFNGIIFYMSNFEWNMIRITFYYSSNCLQTSLHFETTSHTNAYHPSYQSWSVWTLLSLLAQEMSSTNPRLHEQKFGWEDDMHCILCFQINSIQNNHTFINSHHITHHNCLSQQGYKYKVQFFPYASKYRQNYPYELSIYFFSLTMSFTV